MIGYDPRGVSPDAHLAALGFVLGVALALAAFARVSLRGRGQELAELAGRIDELSEELTARTVELDRVRRERNARDRELADRQEPAPPIGDEPTHRLGARRPSRHEHPPKPGHEPE
jgi:hypothetical protein